MPEASNRAVLLVNCHSRRGMELHRQALQELERQGVEVEVAAACSTSEQMTSEAKKAVASCVPVLIVGGGDGTLNAVANVTAGTDTALGVLPLGTGNAFARDLQIGPSLEHACRVIAGGRAERVDVGIANGKLFLNVVTIGLTVRIAQSLQESLKRRFGKLVYVGAVLKALKQIKPFHVTLETENGTVEFETLQVVIGNGKYHAGPFRLSPTAGLTTGKLALYALERSDIAGLLKLAVHLPAGTQGGLPEVHSESTVGGMLITRPSLPIVVDGEVGLRTPLRFTTHPHGLLVIVPRAFRG